MITLKELLSTYWSQTLLLITALGFILKTIFSFVLKKKEISHTILFEKQSEALKTFFKNYASLNSVFDSLPVFQIFDKRFPEKEIDPLIQPSLTAFSASILELELYFKPDVMKSFEEMEKNFFLLNSSFIDCALEEKSTGRSLTEKTNEYFFQKSDMQKINKELLRTVLKKIK